MRGAEIGGSDFVIFAGPCAVESEKQIFTCARQVKECGGKVLMGGCFKPRITPDGFQGLGYEGLAMLAEAGRQYELPVMTEVPSPADAEKIAELADILVVGHQNMQNFSLLSELGGMQRPVILRRGLAASLEQLLDAAEFILSRGNQQVMLCEHGISTFETTTHNTLDLGGISILKKMTHLPVIVDPSHAAGQRDLVRASGPGRARGEPARPDDRDPSRSRSRAVRRTPGTAIRRLPRPDRRDLRVITLRPWSGRRILRGTRGVTSAVASGESGNTSASRVELQQRAERQRILVQFDAVVHQVPHGPIHRGRVVVQRLDVGQRLLDRIGRDAVLFAQVVRDVAQVSHGRRQMSLEGVGIELVVLAADARVQEVAEVVSRRR